MSLIAIDLWQWGGFSSDSDLSIQLSLYRGGHHHHLGKWLFHLCHRLLYLFFTSPSLSQPLPQLLQLSLKLPTPFLLFADPGFHLLSLGVKLGQLPLRPGLQLGCPPLLIFKKPPELLQGTGLLLEQGAKFGDLLSLLLHQAASFLELQSQSWGELLLLWQGLLYLVHCLCLFLL